MDLNILIIGTGMYVCGRGTTDFGTILPALYEWKRSGGSLGEVHVCGTKQESACEMRLRAEKLSRKTKVKFSLFAHPQNDENDIKAYTKVLAQIPRPACAIVVVPDHLHQEIASACMEAGLHTLVVKPLTTNVKDANELITLQEKYGVYGAVEFHKRFDRANLKLKEVLAQGKIGDPLYFIVEYSQRKSIPSEAFALWVERTNIFQYLGCHYIDIIYFATHAKPTRAMATGQIAWLKNHGINTYDAVQGIVEWEGENGKSFLSYIFTNWIDPESTSAMSDQKIKVIGTKGRYESDQKRRGITIISDESGIEEPNPDFCSTYITETETVSYQGYGIESIHTFISDVIDLNLNRITIEHLELLRPTFRESLPSTAVIESVNKSLLEKQGGWVDVVY